MPLHRVRPAPRPPRHEPGSLSFPAIPGQPVRGTSARRVLALCAVLVATGACGTTTARADPVSPSALMGSRAPSMVGGFVAEASQRFGIPAAWIGAVMRAESAGVPRATSPRGAMGLMQIMPETWAGLRQRYGLGNDPYDAHDNIIAGAAYLRELHDRYGSPGFLAAYNAGPQRWEEHLATDRPLPVETRLYLARLAPVMNGKATPSGAVLLAAVAHSWTEAPLFPVRPISALANVRAAAVPPFTSSSSHTRTADLTALAPQSNGLFAALSIREPPQ